jgi:hypothetical protein
MNVNEGPVAQRENDPCRSMDSENHARADLASGLVIFTSIALLEWVASDVLCLLKRHDFSMELAGTSVGIFYGGRFLGIYHRAGRPWTGSLILTGLAICGFLIGRIYRHLLPIFSPGWMAALLGGALCGLAFGVILAIADRLFRPALSLKDHSADPDKQSVGCS